MAIGPTVFFKVVVIGVSASTIGRSQCITLSCPPDPAGITLLQDDGSVVHLLLDLQREEKITMYAMLKFFQKAFKNRRQVRIVASLRKIFPIKKMILIYLTVQQLPIRQAAVQCRKCRIYPILRMDHRAC